MKKKQSPPTIISFVSLIFLVIHVPVFLFVTLEMGWNNLHRCNIYCCLSSNHSKNFILQLLAYHHHYLVLELHLMEGDDTHVVLLCFIERSTLAAFLDYLRPRKEVPLSLF